MNKLIIGLLLMMVLASPSFSQDRVLRDIIESTLALDTNFLVDEANGDTITFETRPYGGSDTLLEITRRNSAEYFSATIALNDGLLRTFCTTEERLTYFSYSIFPDGDEDYEIISGGENFAARDATRKEIIAGKKQMRNELKNIAKAMK